MAIIPMYDPLTSEARSPLIAGLTEACSKLSSILNLKTMEAVDLPLIPIFITTDDQYRIYQAPLGIKLWLEEPTPVIRQNGVVITPQNDEFDIDYFGGSIAFNNGKRLTELDQITADFTYIIDESNLIENLMNRITEIGLNADKFRGYYNNYTFLDALVTSPSGGDFAIVGGEENNIYIWNSTDGRWRPVYRDTDLSDYYNKLETNGLLAQKEDTIVSHGNTTADDDYYYSGRKSWVNVNEKVKSSTLDGLNTSNTEPVTDEDNVLSAVGKLQGQIDNFVHDLFGTGNPTTSTKGEIGQDYTNTSTGEKFHLTEISNGQYIWTPYQEKLDMDDEPTEGSDKPVTSNGIYEALQDKADKVIPTNPGNLVTLDANGNIVDSGKGVEDVGKSPEPVTVTLPASGWANNSAPYTQTIPVEGAIANESKQIVLSSPNPIDSNINVVMDCAVYCTAQGSGTLTFTAFEDKPTEPITFNVVLFNL